MIRALYRVLVWFALPFAILRLLWRARLQPAYLKNLSERFGFSHGAGVERPIWIHAVSVGETRAAEPLIRAIRKRHPAASILLTCTTPTGRATGEQIFRGEIRQAYLPFDLPISVRRFLNQYRPKLGVLMETELWPHLIDACHDLRVPLYLVNARLSERSARRYQRLGSFASNVLRKIDTVAAQADADAQRFVCLGATNVKVCGNLKFDRGPSPSDLDLAKRFRDLVGERSVIVAASTREGEEELLLEAWKSAARGDTLLLLIPRHPQRFDEVAALIERQGFAAQRRSDNQSVRPTTEVWLGDSMGEMFAYQGAGDVVVIGGSFLQYGGQNLLEACSVGKPVIVGPNMFNFSEATQLALDANAALRVTSMAEAVLSALALLGDPERRQKMGESGQRLMRIHQGATERVLGVLGL